MSKWLRFGKRPALPFKLLFARFRQLLDNNTTLLQVFADAAEKQSGEYIFDRRYVETLVDQIFDLGGKIVYDLNSIADQKYASLYPVLDRLRAEATGDLVGQPVVAKADLCLPLDEVDESQVNLCGGKAAHLGEIRNRLSVPMPPGFVVTTYAYLQVVKKNNLEDLIVSALDRMADDDPSGCEEVSQRLRQATLPRELRRALKRAARRVDPGGGPLFLAVRSSALGEDADLSFAGQYRTVLQVKPSGIVDAYRNVLSSLYLPSAVTYRKTAGLPPRGLMAVACMKMVTAETSGVLYTVDPNDPRSGTMLIGATRGLASRAVQGSQSLASYVVSRQPPHDLTDYRPATTSEVVRGRAEGGVETVTDDALIGEGRELSDEEVRELCQLGMRIERYFKLPQDIEWARDENGTLFVIQARRLQVSTPPELPRHLPDALSKYEVLIDGQGYVACRGVAAGKVVLVTGDDDLQRIESGSVLVARRASPRFVKAMPQASAIVTDIGAPTGHMAALAREFRVPTLVDCGNATTRLTEGQEVTVDADDNKVYAGRVEELMSFQLASDSGFEDEPELRLLRRLLSRLTPLTLVDPQADSFRPERCHTIHDIIRFAHEKAVEELVDLHTSQAVAGAENARRLASEIPLGLFLIDIGGGLDASQLDPSPRVPVGPQALRSAPMRALWDGLTTPGVWRTEPVPVEFRTFMSSAMTRRFDVSSGRNLAVLSEEYVNLSLNLGYHFNMVDALLSDSRDANHIYFRFLGGASESERRIRRATMVREILERLDFSVRQSRDLVVGRVSKLRRAEAESRLQTIGRLIGYTRQMDALMDSEETSMHYVESFLRGDYSPD